MPIYDNFTEMVRDVVGYARSTGHTVGYSQDFVEHRTGFRDSSVIPEIRWQIDTELWRQGTRALGITGIEMWDRVRSEAALHVVPPEEPGHGISWADYYNLIPDSTLPEDFWVIREDETLLLDTWQRAEGEILAGMQVPKEYLQQEPQPKLPLTSFERLLLDDLV